LPYGKRASVLTIHNLYVSWKEATCNYSAKDIGYICELQKIFNQDWVALVAVFSLIARLPVIHSTNNPFA